MHKCRICFFEVNSLDAYEFGETVIKKIGDVIVGGCSEHTAITEGGHGKFTHSALVMLL